MLTQNQTFKSLRFITDSIHIPTAYFSRWIMRIMWNVHLSIFQTPIRFVSNDLLLFPHHTQVKKGKFFYIWGMKNAYSCWLKFTTITAIAISADYKYRSRYVRNFELYTVYSSIKCHATYFLKKVRIHWTIANLPSKYF